ncbi:hypothetical protein PFAG_05409 [Plasmodium falciparum Santa Lucia]|uniref:Uncharacterized protein n=1 Tax=Plasmodium falciparum Santa Lucia TaxID=478859 RepID=W7FX72_PLAFA|nr:hypothetical protein PFAG_05409 [Plasmodium falciparum Santa Lucia]
MRTKHIFMMLWNYIYNTDYYIKSKQVNNSLEYIMNLYIFHNLLKLQVYIIIQISQMLIQFILKIITLLIINMMNNIIMYLSIIFRMITILKMFYSTFIINIFVLHKDIILCDQYEKYNDNKQIVHNDNYYINRSIILYNLCNIKQYTIKNYNIINQCIHKLYNIMVIKQKNTYNYITKSYLCVSFLNQLYYSKTQCIMIYEKNRYSISLDHLWKSNINIYFKKILLFLLLLLLLLLFSSYNNLNNTNVLQLYDCYKYNVHNNYLFIYFNTLIVASILNLLYIFYYVCINKFCIYLYRDCIISFFLLYIFILYLYKYYNHIIKIRDISRLSYIIYVVVLLIHIMMYIKCLYNLIRIISLVMFFFVFINTSLSYPNMKINNIIAYYNNTYNSICKFYLLYIPTIFNMYKYSSLLICIYFIHTINVFVNCVTFILLHFIMILSFSLFMDMYICSAPILYDTHLSKKKIMNFEKDRRYTFVSYSSSYALMRTINLIHLNKLYIYDIFIKRNLVGCHGFTLFIHEKHETNDYIVNNNYNIVIVLVLILVGRRNRTIQIEDRRIIYKLPVIILNLPSRKNKIYTNIYSCEKHFNTKLYCFFIFKQRNNNEIVDGVHNEKSKNYYMNDHVKFVKNKKSFLIQTYSDLYHFKNYNDNKIFNNISLCYNINLEHRMNNVQKYIHADMSIHFKKNYKRDKGINQYIYNYKHNFYLRVFNFLLNFIKRTKNVINIVLSRGLRIMIKRIYLIKI